MLQIGSKLATIYITGNSDNKAISFSVESKPDYHNTGSTISSSYNWSNFFKITRRNNGDGIVRLKNSLEGAFQVRNRKSDIDTLQLLVLLNGKDTQF